jgi:hypothetical protein
MLPDQPPTSSARTLLMQSKDSEANTTEADGASTAKR